MTSFSFFLKSTSLIVEKVSFPFGEQLFFRLRTFHVAILGQNLDRAWKSLMKIWANLFDMWAR